MTTHHFSVDVEEYFQVSAFEPFVRRDAWDRIDSRVAAQVDELLRLLEGHQATATFFVLGWIAERRPEVVTAIAAAGAAPSVSPITLLLPLLSLACDNLSYDALVGGGLIGYLADP